MGEGENLSIYVNLKSTDSKEVLSQGDDLEVGRIMVSLFENPGLQVDKSKMEWVIL